MSAIFRVLEYLGAEAQVCRWLSPINQPQCTSSSVKAFIPYHQVKRKMEVFVSCAVTELPMVCQEHVQTC